MPLNELLSDPDFQSLSLEGRKAAIQQVAPKLPGLGNFLNDPDWQGLSPEGQRTALLQYAHQANPERQQSFTLKGPSGTSPLMAFPPGSPEGQMSNLLAPWTAMTAAGPAAEAIYEGLQGLSPVLRYIPPIVTGGAKGFIKAAPEARTGVPALMGGGIGELIGGRTGAAIGAGLGALPGIGAGMWQGIKEELAGMGPKFEPGLEPPVPSRFPPPIQTPSQPTSVPPPAGPVPKTEPLTPARTRIVPPPPVKGSSSARFAPPVPQAGQLGTTGTLGGPVHELTSGTPLGTINVIPEPPKGGPMPEPPGEQMPPLDRVELNRMLHAKVQRLNLPNSPAGQKSPGLLSGLAQSEFGTTYDNLTLGQMRQLYHILDTKVVK